MSNRMLFLGSKTIERCFPRGINNARFDRAYPSLTNKHIHVTLRWSTSGYNKVLSTVKLVKDDNCRTAKFGYNLSIKLLDQMSDSL